MQPRTYKNPERIFFVMQILFTQLAGFEFNLLKLSGISNLLRVCFTEVGFVIFLAFGSGKLMQTFTSSNSPYILLHSFKELKLFSRKFGRQGETVF